VFASTAVPASTAAPFRRHSPTVVALRPGFWRIVHPGGAVLGYVELEHTAAGEQFRARRLIASTTRVVEIGEFWSLDDAVMCFGY
jgi:hypothetical protein